MEAIKFSRWICPRLNWFYGGIFLVVLWFGLELLPWNLGTFSPSPTDAFQRAFGQPPPAKVLEMVVVSRQYLFKCWFRMRFRASDKTITSLVSQGRRINDATRMKAALGGELRINNKYDAIDKQTVHWEVVSSIKNPEVYSISSFSPSDGLMWYSDVIVDRSNGLIYVFACND